MQQQGTSQKRALPRGASVSATSSVAPRPTIASFRPLVVLTDGGRGQGAPSSGLTRRACGQRPRRPPRAVDAQPEEGFVSSWWVLLSVPLCILVYFAVAIFVGSYIRKG